MSSDTTTQEQWDEKYELVRVNDETAFLQKMRLKRRLYKLFGEIYVGRRAKFAYFKRWLTRLDLPATARIIEVGSGDGVFAFYLANRFPQASVVGLELNPTEASVCQTLATTEGLSNLRFEEGILGPQYVGRFDFLYSLDVLEHIPDDLAAMRQMYDALVEGGTLLVHVPNRTYRETDGRMISLPDHEAWKINPGHVRQGYAPDNLHAKLESVGFEVKEVQQTQAKAITYAHRLYASVERRLPLRILILPLIDALIFADTRKAPDHGNTVWAWAQKPRTGTNAVS